MEERRKTPRTPVDLKARYGGTEEQAPKECTIHELSPEGARVRTKEQATVGQSLKLKIEIPSVAGPVDSEIIIKWSKMIHDDRGRDFQAGGELRITDSQAKQALLAWLASCAKI